jgi:predicted MFS family arabinose efflux permease
VAGSLITAAAPNLVVFMAGRGLAALGHGVFFAIATPALIRLARPEARDRVGARVAVGGSVALVAGTPVATLLGQLTGWRTATVVVAAVALALAAAAVRVLPPMPSLREEDRGSGQVWPTARAPGVAVLLAAVGLTVAGHFTLFTYVAPFAGRLGLAGTAFSAALFGFGITAVLGSSSAGWVGQHRPVAGARAAAAAFTLATGGLWVAGLLESAVLGVPLLMLWSGAFALTFLSAWLGVLRRVPPAGAETAGALFNIVFQLGIVAGSALGSVFARTGAIGVLPLVTAAAGLAVLGLTGVAGGAYRGRSA